MRGEHKRLFSLFLAFALAANLLSAAMITAGAAEASGGVILSKTVTLQGDGTYQIDLSGFVDKAISREKLKDLIINQIDLLLIRAVKL